MDAKGSFSVAGKIVNIFTKEIFWGEVVIEGQTIRKINRLAPGQPGHEAQTGFILPGFVDSHVHIESSMLVPSEFAKLAVVHGTVATVSDPHEIANVCGMAGVEFMIENGKTVPFKFNFGAPSCVPATNFETAGAELNANDVKQLLRRDDIKYLSEMMNFPGVLHGDEEVMKKLTAALQLGKPIDGHAPGLRGEEARRYIMAGALNPTQGKAPLNLSEGETLDADNLNSGYRYQTADPSLYGMLKEHAGEGKKNPTEAEMVLWQMLSGKKLEGYKFRRQHIIGTYIADFVCLQHKLIVEVDGLIHELQENRVNDIERTKILTEWGFQVIRFTNNEVLFETEKTLSVILQKLNQLKNNQAAAFSSPLGLGATFLPPSGLGAVISTDHECFTKEEALDKLQHGMNIIIREGSAAKNFDALVDLIDEHPHKMMLCSDDKHPDSLVEGHINQLCARAVAKGNNIFNILQAACINPVLHYQLDVGLLREGDAADFIVVDDLINFTVQQTYINGELVADGGKSLIHSKSSAVINHFNCSKKTIADFEFHLNKFGNSDAENIEQVYVVEVLDGQLITNKIIEPISSFTIQQDIIQPNTEKDLLYMVVVNRYSNAPVAKCFVKNFGLQHGAIASSVAHDSHNIIAVGVNAESICKAVNLIIEAKGGITAVGEKEMMIKLPVAGLMSNEDGYEVAMQYSAIDAYAKQLGSTLAAPFMSLSFMGLLVIPHLKLSDKGLFDGDVFHLL
jgi:adenine deaminase